MLAIVKYFPRCFLRVPYFQCSSTKVSRFSSQVAAPLTPSFDENTVVELDRLFTRVQLEYRGHDKAVLKSYTTFLKAVCEHLELKIVSIKVFPYVWWIQNALKAKFAKKKNQIHYETRTHIRQFTIQNVTGSTASTFLEYIQRNIPEGVAMKVTYDEIAPLPEMVQSKVEMLQFDKENDKATRSMNQEEKSKIEALLIGNMKSSDEFSTSTDGTKADEKF